jgi:hypothetical protein
MLFIVIQVQAEKQAVRTKKIPKGKTNGKKPQDGMPKPPIIPPKIPNRIMYIIALRT